MWLSLLLALASAQVPPDADAGPETNPAHSPMSARPMPALPAPLTPQQQRDQAETSADTLRMDLHSQQVVLQGHARLRTHGLLLRADTLTWDPLTRHAQADGAVTFLDGRLVGVADSLSWDVDAQKGVFHQATLYEKRPIAQPLLEAADTPLSLCMVGRNALTLKADELERLGGQAFVAERLVVTPCDCRDDAGAPTTPSWSVRASRADVRPGDRVWLTWPVIYVGNVPVLPLPVLELPLSDRRTGLLLPKPNFTSKSGFQLEQPFFWAINGWSDVTVTPGYFFGRTNNPASAPETRYNTGLKGPRLGLEARYTPSEGTRGKIDLAGIYDLKPAVGLDASGNEAVDGRRGLRGELSWQHQQALPWGFSDHLDLSMVSDARYFNDVTADLIAAQALYLRSDARVDQHTAWTSTWLDASYFQDLSAGASPVHGDLQRPFFGGGEVNATTFQRVPELGFSAGEQRLGPFGVSLEASGARYAPLQAHADRVARCLALHPSPDPSVAPVECQREVAERVDVAPTLRLPITLGRFGEVAPYVQLREDAWRVEAATSADRTLLLVGATARTELSRVFESGTAASPVKWRHVIAPELELRGMPWVRESGEAPEVANDEVDSAVRSHTLLQGIASLKTRLDRKEGAGVTTVLKAEVGQGVDLLQQRPSEAFARVQGQCAELSGTGTARFDPESKRLTSLTARVAWSPPQGFGFSAGYTRLDAHGTDAMAANLTELVGPALTDASRAPIAAAQLAPGALAESLDLGVRFHHLPFDADLGLNLLPHVLAADPDPAASRAHQLGLGLLGARLGLGYTSPCDCWGVHAQLYFAQPFATGNYLPNVAVVLDAQRLGGARPF